MNMYTEEERKGLLKGLLQVKEHILAARKGAIDKLPWDEMLGICWAIKTYFRSSASSSMLFDIFQECPSFSGSSSYPVKHPDMDPETAFYVTEEHEMWREGVYADNRLQLLSEAIDMLTNNINIDQIPAGITKETL